MAIFNSYVCLPEGNSIYHQFLMIHLFCANRRLDQAAVIATTWAHPGHVSFRVSMPIRGAQKLDAEKCATRMLV